MKDEHEQTSDIQVFPLKSGTLLLLRPEIMLMSIFVFGLFNITSFVIGYYFGQQEQQKNFIYSTPIPQTVCIPPLSDIEKKNTEEKSEVESALENNAEFRKIHDFLQRENPVEFKIPEK